MFSFRSGAALNYSPPWETAALACCVLPLPVVLLLAFLPAADRLPTAFLLTVALFAFVLAGALPAVAVWVWASALFICASFLALKSLTIREM